MMHDSGLHEIDVRTFLSDLEWQSVVQAMLSECSPQEIADFDNGDLFSQFGFPNDQDYGCSSISSLSNAASLQRAIHNHHSCNPLHVLPSGMNLTFSTPDM